MNDDVHSVNVCVWWAGGRGLLSASACRDSKKCLFQPVMRCSQSGWFDSGVPPSQRQPYHCVTPLFTYPGPVNRDGW